jgi:hypothetical protein
MARLSAPERGARSRPAATPAATPATLPRMKPRVLFAFMSFLLSMRDVLMSHVLLFTAGPELPAKKH